MTDRTRTLAIIAVTGLVAAACGEAGGTTPQEDTAGQSTRTINVEVTQVQPQDFTHFVQVVGTVEGERDVTVSAEEGGVVESLGVRKGQQIRAGDVILRLDDDVLRAQVDQAESQAALAQEQWQRQRRLWEQDSVGTEIQYLQARYNAETAAASARSLRERLERKTVRSPISGVLDDRMVEVGTMVAPGAPVARVIDLDSVKIEAGVPERFAPDIQDGAEVVVNVDALAGRQYSGRVDFIGSAVDRDNRTFEVEVLVPNPGLGIKPGMVANVRIARRTIPEALAVPRHAVLRRENGYVVYVATDGPDGPTAAVRTVTLGAARGDHVVIREGLEAGDRVVTVGQQQIAEGDLLNITETRTAEVPDVGAAREAEDRV